jgi:hypothetical protein
MNENRYCSYCGEECKEKTDWCKMCGEPISGIKICENCGVPLENSEMCNHCGKDVNDSTHAKFLNQVKYVKCKNCNNLIVEGSNYCTWCVKRCE